MDAAAEKMLAAVPSVEQRAYHRRSLPNTLYRITRDEISINYSHLEMLARHHSIPTGLMLLFTRLQAELADWRGGGADQARKTVLAVDAALEVIRDALEDGRPGGRAPALGRTVLRQVTHAYQQSLAPEQPQFELAVSPRRRRRQAGETP